MTTWDFPCSEPVDISVDSWLSGSIAISGEPTSSILVEVLPTFDGRGAEELLQELQVSFDDGRLYVRGPRYASHRRKTSLDLIIKTPAGSACTAKTASADVACIGELGELTVQTASGDVTADVISGDATIHSASGDVLLNGASGTMSRSTRPPATSRRTRSRAICGSTPPAATSPLATARARCPATPPAATSVSAASCRVRWTW